LSDWDILRKSIQSKKKDGGEDSWKDFVGPAHKWMHVQPNFTFQKRSATAMISLTAFETNQGGKRLEGKKRCVVDE
jgi:hypothetical protein